MSARDIASAWLIRALCLFGTSAAEAARPLVTDDAGVLDAGDCEIETVVDRVQVRGEPAYLGGLVQSGCGIGQRTQLSLFGARLDGEPPTTHAGFAGKTALIAMTESSAGLAIGYSFEWARQNGQSFRSDSGLLVAIATFPFEKNWFAHINAGWLRTQQPRGNALFWGAAIEREAVADSRLDLMAETYGDGEGSPWLALGARFHAIDQKLSINGSIAIKSGGGERETQVTIGARLTF